MWLVCQCVWEGSHFNQDNYQFVETQKNEHIFTLIQVTIQYMYVFNIRLPLDTTVDRQSVGGSIYFTIRGDKKTDLIVCTLWHIDNQYYWLFSNIGIPLDTI